MLPAEVAKRPGRTMLDREEYIEQAHLFGLLQDRIPQNVPLQDALQQAKDEVLATSKLTLAIDFLLTELRHSGCLAPAMRRLSHYFTGFQSFVIESAEDERGRFDMRIAVQMLKSEASYRADSPLTTAVFLFQFECLSRNRLSYDAGLQAMTQDPIYNPDWQAWITTVRRQIGLVDFADLVYVRSDYYRLRKGAGGQPAPPEKPVLFGLKEGRIAWANRRKDPLYLFAALQRQLGYPQVPRPRPPDETPQLIPQLLKRMDRLETRLKLMEEEQRKGAIDLPKFYQNPGAPPLPLDDE
jgi:hypothetical protein